MKYGLLIISMLLHGSLGAQEARPLADKPLIEAQVQRLSKELRCLVCQNQTLADSNAPLAEDLRVEIREMAAQGKSDQAIIDYLVARYGDFVLYRPPFKSLTLLLWLGPFALLGLAAVVLVQVLRRQKSEPALPLDIDQEQAVAELLKRKS